MVLPLANINGMIEYLILISQATPKSKYAVVVMDRALWHPIGKIKCFENVIPIPLPQYSPERDPVEQLWQHLKQRYLSNIAFNNYDDIVDKSCKAWNNI